MSRQVRADTPFCGKQEPFVFGPWKFMAEKSHILTIEETERLSLELSLPQLPEMTFGGNKLSIQHASGFGIEFNAINALRLVDAHNDLMKVAMAKEWKESRESSEYISHTVKPFDWTFSTNYKGSVNDPSNVLKITKTEKRIDIERLKRREKILFFEELMLFEDELADNGCAQLTTKIRVMPSCFFLLMRFFLRVDGVLSRIYDTRLYHEFQTDYLIREYSEKEKGFKEMRNISPAILTDPNLLDGKLTLKSRVVEEIAFNLNESEKNTVKNQPTNIQNTNCESSEAKDSGS